MCSINYCYNLPFNAISLAAAFCKKPMPLTAAISLGSAFFARYAPVISLQGRNVLEQLSDYIDYFEAHEDMDAFLHSVENWRAGEYLHVVYGMCAAGAWLDFFRTVANNVGLIDAAELSARLGSCSFFGVTPFALCHLASFSSAMTMAARTISCIGAIREKKPTGESVSSAAFFGLALAVQVTEIVTPFFGESAKTLLSYLRVARKIAGFARHYFRVTEPFTFSQPQPVFSREGLHPLKRGLLKVADVGYCAWQAVLELNGRIVGVDVLAIIASNGLANARSHYASQGAETPRLNETITWLDGAHDTIQAGPMALIAWDNLFKAMRRPENLAKIPTPFYDLSLVTEVFGRTIALGQMLNSWGIFKHFGSISAKIGSSPLLSLCQIATLSQVKNGMLVLTALLRIAQASVIYYKTFSETNELIINQPAFKHATQFFLLTCANESFKALTLIYLGMGTTGMAIQLISASFQITQELVTSHYLGEIGPDGVKRFRFFRHLTA